MDEVQLLLFKVSRGCPFPFSLCSARGSSRPSNSGKIVTHYYAGLPMGLPHHEVLTWASGGLGAHVLHEKATFPVCSPGAIVRLAEPESLGQNPVNI